MAGRYNTNVTFFVWMQLSTWRDSGVKKATVYVYHVLITSDDKSFLKKKLNNVHYNYFCNYVWMSEKKWSIRIMRRTKTIQRQL